MPAEACEPGCTCALHPPSNVSNAPFRIRARALIEGGAQPADLARAAGFTRQRSKTLATGETKLYEVGDSSTFLRMVGLRAAPSRKGYTTMRKTVNPQMAQQLCDALELDYTEVGI